MTSSSSALTALCLLVVACVAAQVNAADDRSAVALSAERSQAVIAMLKDFDNDGRHDGFDDDWRHNESTCEEWHEDDDSDHHGGDDDDGKDKDHHHDGNATRTPRPRVTRCRRPHHNGTKWNETNITTTTAHITTTTSRAPLNATGPQSGAYRPSLFSDAVLFGAVSALLWILASSPSSP